VFGWKNLKILAFQALLTLLGLLLGLWCTLLLAVDDQPSPGLLLVPLEACEDGGLELIIGLQMKKLAFTSASELGIGAPRSYHDDEALKLDDSEMGQQAYLLSELLVDCI
jgi:hypothetical protein